MADVTVVPSPANSMAGYSFITFIKRNKDKIKLLLSALGTYLTAQITGIANQPLNVLVSTVVGVVIYCATAAVDFYLTDNPGSTPA